MIRYTLTTLVWQQRFTYLKSILFDDQALHQSGAKFQIIKFSPKTNIGPHYHKHAYEIFFIESGSGTLIFNAKRYPAQAGDIFLCEPNDVHEIINDSFEKELVILIFKTNAKKTDIVWLSNNTARISS
jgi:quercetin dioxygenase-like cupin family protein